VFETSAGPEPQTEYELNKAPVESILRVTGTSNGQSTIFVAEADFTLSSDGNLLVWEDEPANEPDPGSVFFVNYTTDSIISRYLDASEEQFDIVIEDVETALSSKFIDTSSGLDLDQIGKLFGPIIGRRAGRSDGEYRVYLKAVVRSFVSRGTVPGIRAAISSATIADAEDVSVIEFFDVNEFSVSVALDSSTPFDNAITGSVIEDAARLSSPSGVRLRRVSFAPKDADENIGIGDFPTVRDALDTSDGMVADDFAAFDRRSSLDTSISDDSVIIDPNQTTTFDVQVSADAFAIDPNKIVTADTQVDIDAVTIDTASINDLARWEENVDPEDVTWNFFSWARLVDLFNDDVVDTSFSFDAVSLDPNTTTVTDTTGVDGSSVDTLIEDPDDYRWNTTEASEDVTWDFFSWVARGVTDVPDLFISTPEAIDVDDVVSFPAVPTGRQRMLLIRLTLHLPETRTTTGGTRTQTVSRLSGGSSHGFRAVSLTQMTRLSHRQRTSPSMMWSHSRR